MVARNPLLSVSAKIIPNSHFSFISHLDVTHTYLEIHFRYSIPEVSSLINNPKVIDFV